MKPRHEAKVDRISTHGDEAYRATCHVTGDTASVPMIGGLRTVLDKLDALCTGGTHAVGPIPSL